jgi:hypothetical protein
MSNLHSVKVARSVSPYVSPSGIDLSTGSCTKPDRRPIEVSQQYSVPWGLLNFCCGCLGLNPCGPQPAWS